MKEVINFIKAQNVESTTFYTQLKCSVEEAKILQYMSKEYVNGRDTLGVIDVLGEFYDLKTYKHLEKLDLIKSLLEFGWIVQVSFDQVKLSEVSKLELINSSISLSSAYLKMLENGSNDFILPEIKNYSDHLEYLQDQFFRIDLAQQLNVVRKNFDVNSPSSNRLKSKLILLENRIKERIKVTNNAIMLVDFFKDNDLDEQEQTLFLALLKEEYSGGDGSLRDMNSLIELISSDESGTLSNGDMLKFEFTSDYLDTLLTEGKAVTDKTFKVKVSDLKDINKISKLDTLYSKIPDLVKEEFKDKPAGEYGSYDLTYKVEPQKSFIQFFDDEYYDEAYLSLVITYKITGTQTWVKDDTLDNKKKGDVETKEVYTYLGYQNVEVYKDAVVLSDLSETSGLSWSNYLDIDAVYTDLEKSGYGEYQPKN